MVFLNAWVFFGFIPLYILYKKESQTQNRRQIRYLYISLACMLLSFSRPVLQNSLTDEKFDSQDYIIAIDASYSMQADDLKPSRYVMAKKAIKKLLALHPKDRFTLFAFTANTLLISPPTTDTQISIQALDALNPAYILTKSTNLLNLFKTISKGSLKEKNLIIFSDGGDENNINTLVSIIQKNNITPYFVATATKKGAALKKDGIYIKYYQLNSLDSIDTLSDDIISQKQQTSQTVQVKEYKEFFYVPLILAILLFFISVTKIHQLYGILALFIFPYKSDAGILDFYHIQEANSAFKKQKYLQGAQEFEKVAPSIQSYYNIANAYYKAGHYKLAMQYYAKIQTHQILIKKAILYNSANCAVHLKKYDTARKLYIHSLILGDDKDALYNLNLLKSLHLHTKKDITSLLPQKNSQSKEDKKIKQKKDKSEKKKNNSSKSSANKNASQTTNGKGSDKNKIKKQVSKKKSTPNNYKIGYKAYEKINKGYSDEKTPW